MKGPEVLILGCGYTGQRVARLLLASGVRVVATAQRPSTLATLAAAGAVVVRLEVREPETVRSLRDAAEQGVLVVHSIPVIRGERGEFDPTPQLLGALADRPARVVYLSTTGVYGEARRVDEATPVAPPGRRERLRIDAERAVAGGPWSSLILRPAAIYGPGRGVHESMRSGRFRLAGDGGNLVSRIHVDDLAAHVEAALFSEVTGAYPVADEDPCTSREIAQFCAGLLGQPLPSSVTTSEAGRTKRANRRVDGGAIRRLLGVRLRYASYRAGVPAALDSGDKATFPSGAG
jgi:nucleoside-diphosphate-sugar epimerase